MENNQEEMINISFSVGDKNADELEVSLIYKAIDEMVDERCQRIKDELERTKIPFPEILTSDSDSDGDYDSDLEDVLTTTVINHEEPYHKDDCQSIYLRYCHQLGVVPVKIFTRNCNSSSVNLKHYGVGVKGACAIASALRYNQTIEELNLHDNGIGEEGTKAICEMMVVNLWITRLDLSDNCIGKDGVQALVNMLGKAVRLKTLNLSKCKINSNSAKELILALSENTSLEWINLSDNEIGDQGANCFQQMLSNNSSLKYLDISLNCITYRSIEALCNGLTNNMSLEDLSLAWNGLGDAGASAIGPVLDYNITLRVLNLAHNHITATGIERIADSLQSNTTLEVIRLGNNPFLAYGARKILQALGENPDTSIRELSLSGIAFDKSCEDELSALKNMKPRLVCTWNGSFQGGEVIGGEQALPTELYLNAIYSQGFRLLDFFRYLTKDGTLLSKEDFINGSKKRNFPFSPRELAGLFDYLDTKRSGLISFEEFLFVKNDTKQAKMKQKRKSMSHVPESPIPQFQRLIRS